jgi:tetratricopeptide (TPR) repeat protein
MPLPGQPLVQPKPGVIGRGAGVPTPPAQAPNRPPTSAGVAAPRPSQMSKAPHEVARKAEKIFEQAVKDHAEGRISSALQNAKLAVMFDSTVPAYKEFLNELTALGAGARSPNAGKPRELMLFEEASEAEGKGEFEKAVKLLQEAIEIAPKTAALRNRLGVVLSIRLKRHDEALVHLKMAIDLEPGNIVYMNNFSKVTAMLDSQLQNAPEKKKKLSFFGGAEEAGKVEIKKIRPKMF